jgi:hypothetical protein
VDQKKRDAIGGAVGGAVGAGAGAGAGFGIGSFIDRKIRRSAADELYSGLTSIGRGEGQPTKLMERLSNLMRRDPSIIPEAFDADVDRLFPRLALDSTTARGFNTFKKLGPVLGALLLGGAGVGAGIAAARAGHKKEASMTFYESLMGGVKEASKKEPEMRGIPKPAPEIEGKTKVLDKIRGKLKIDKDKK